MTTIRATEIRKRTEKAIQILPLIAVFSASGPRSIWLPISQIRSEQVIDGRYCFEVPDWLADSKAKEIGNASANGGLFY